MSGAESAETPFRRFRKLTHKLAAVSKRELEEQREQKARKRPAAPKPT